MSEPAMRIIADLGQALGMPGLAAHDNVCELAIDGRHRVQLIVVGSRRQILMSCAVGPAALEPRHAVLMAQANFMQAGGGAVLCTAPDGRAHVQLAVPFEHASASGLIAALEALLAQIDVWDERLNRADTRGRPAGPPGFFMQPV
jgi:hypothetical protein